LNRTANELRLVGQPAHDPATLLNLQRTAGNRAVVGAIATGAARSGSNLVLQRKPEFGPFTPTTNHSLEAVTTGHLGFNGAERRAFGVLDRALTGVWKELDWATVSAEAATRIRYPDDIDQGVLNLCGPAAALHAQASQAAVEYAKLVVRIFRDGTVDKSKVMKQRLLDNAPAAGMSQCDWMVLSALTETTNQHLDYYGEAGFQDYIRGGRYDFSQLERDLKTVGNVKTKVYKCLTSGELEAAKKVSQLLKDNPTDVVVLMSISTDRYNKKWYGIVDHCIRLLDPVLFGQSGPQEVMFNAYSWGKRSIWAGSAGEFSKVVYGFTVGTRNDSITL
jgi:hypothetical protein